MFGTLGAMGGVAAFAAYTNSKSKSQSELEPEMKKVKIPWAEKLRDGEMRALKVGQEKDDKVLISRVDGKLYATSNYCSHFGVPLDGGMMIDDKVLCPAHLAGFSVVTGEVDRAPALDGLTTFKVVEENGESFVQVPEGPLPRKQSQTMAKRDPENKTHFVIIGGGPAGLNAAETLRQSGFTG